MVEQRLADGFGGGPDIDEQRRVIGNERRRGAADGVLGLGPDAPEGSVAPPCTRVSRRWSQSWLRSLRMVCTETPK
jgi:hypothetical protein